MQICHFRRYRILYDLVAHGEFPSSRVPNVPKVAGEIGPHHQNADSNTIVNPPVITAIFMIRHGVTPRLVLLFPTALPLAMNH